ncbi:RNA 2'-phosphotransferase [Clostridiales bacterium CHKCI001]|nr:RNA 2'-phosphotransferase [Clostridiales bacterium CHKCI001]
MNEKIRAYYGHSIPLKIVKEMKTPPDILYHGTARRFLSSIEEKGLLSQGRQYVHLSQDMETAYNVAKRHDKKPVILKIDAKQAWEDGVKFYYGNEKVWLANKIPSEYIIKDDTVISDSEKHK